MRIVVDTNVFVSAAIKDSSLPATAIYLVRQHGTLLKSAATEAQFMEVLDRPYLAKLIAPASRDWLYELMASAEYVEIIERISACRDPTDDKFLELAVNGYADLVVSGDADLRVLNPFRGIPIVSPAIYVGNVRRQ